MKMRRRLFFNLWAEQSLLLYNRWPWHVCFWTGYILFRFWLYYITVTYYPKIFLEYMLLCEVGFVCITYFTLWLYGLLFANKKYVVYFLAGGSSWMLFQYGKTVFQFYYLRNEPAFKGSSFTDIFLNSVTFVLAYFLFLTSCKYFKDGYISQHFESERKQRKLMAEANNLKSQIAPHFLFNTLNNLYGLAVDKSDKLPGLMLRLSDLLRHALYETQKPLVGLNEEINVVKSYIQLESVRLEDNLQLRFDNVIPEDAAHLIAPLILIVFVENAFKHARLVQSEPVNIYIKSILEDDQFSFIVENNYNQEKENSKEGIGLTNVRRRLEVLYPNNRYQLTIQKDDSFYSITLELQLVKPI